MHHCKNLLSRAGLLLALAFITAATSRAQLAAAGLPGQRALGHRYVDVSAGVVAPDVAGIDRNGALVSLGVNLPVSANVDFGLSYAWGTVRPPAGRITDYTLLVSAVVHSGGEGVKPFLGAQFGYERMKLRVGSLKVADDRGVWGLAAGVEIPVGRVTLTPSLTYADAASGESDAALHTSVQAGLWFTPRVGGYVDATFSSFRDAGGDSWSYRAGLRLKF